MAYYIQRQQVGMEEVNITDTERYILSALLAGFGSTKDLCRKTREKMDRLMARYVQPIQISKHNDQLLLSNLRIFPSIPKRTLEALSRRLLPAIEAYFESEEGQREYAEWEAQQTQ